MKLTFTDAALSDLIRLREFIDAKNSAAARTASQQLRANIKTLIEHPQLGRAIFELDEFRELIVHSYVVRYRLLESEIVVLKIWHEREDRE